MSAASLPQVVGRLAPSPTGGLHVGHARTFLIAWLAARSAGGRVILRIEDIDRSRVRPGAIQGMIADLLWMGLDWDEGPDVGGPHAPYLQSERMAHYAAALDILKKLWCLYPCTCTRADVARAASAPHAPEQGPGYHEPCSRRRAADAAELGDRTFTWRCEAPGSADFRWQDLVRGWTSGHAEEGGDFVVSRSSGEPSYQLAVVVDDATMGITQVVRGDDLVPSTPKQLLLYRVLGQKPPEFGHVPLVLGPDGQRLAKRDGSIKLATLRERGVDPRVLVGRIARSFGQGPGLRSPRSLVEGFSLGSIPPEPWVMPSIEELLARTPA